MICQWAQCQNQATQGVCLRWRYRGAPADAEPAVTAPVVHVCAAHAPISAAQEWFGPEQRTYLAASLRAAGLAEPDFGTADVILQPLQ